MIHTKTPTLRYSKEIVEATRFVVERPNTMTASFKLDVDLQLSLYFHVKHPFQFFRAIG